MWKVMLVDDDKMVIEDMKNLIEWEKNGFSIVSIQNNGKKALEDIKTYHPDIVFTDVVMPVMNGIELLRNIKELGTDTVVVLLSSYSEFSYAKEAIKLGVYDYILKDEMNEDLLLSMLREIEKYKNTNREINQYVAEQKMTELFRKPETEETNTEGETQHRMHYFICELDAPLPYLRMINENDREWSLKQGEYNRLREVENEAFRIRYVGKLSETGIVIELEGKRSIYSETELLAQLRAFGREIQSVYETANARTLSVFMIKEKMTAREAAGCYREKEKQLCNKYFVGTRLLMDIDDERLENQCTYTGIDMEKLYACIRSLDEQKTLEVVENAFKEEQETKDYKGLIFLLDTCLYLIKSMCQDYELVDPSSRDPIDACLDIERIRHWVLSLFQDVFAQMRQKKKYTAEVQMALAYIEANYGDESLCIQRVADAVKMSYTHISFLFKKEVGQTIGDYILLVRMEKAKKLLQKGSYKIYEVAKLTGFGDSQYFSQVFRKMTGHKPKEYRGRKL